MDNKKDTNSNKETRVVHVAGVPSDDYDEVQAFGIPLTVFIRDCFKKRADEIRVDKQKKK